MKIECHSNVWNDKKNWKDLRQFASHCILQPSQLQHNTNLFIIVPISNISTEFDMLLRPFHLDFYLVFMCALCMLSLHIMPNHLHSHSFRFPFLWFLKIHANRWTDWQKHTYYWIISCIFELLRGDVIYSPIYCQCQCLCLNLFT